MIAKIFSRALVGHIISLFETLIRLLNNLATDDAHLSELKQTLNDYYARLTQALKADRIYSELKGLDKLRDDAFTNIYYDAKSKERWSHAEFHEAAISLWKICEKYGLDTVRKSYHLESAEIYSFLDEVLEGPNAQAIESIPNTTSLIQELANMQDAFDQQNDAYLKELKKNKDNKSATKLAFEARNWANTSLFTYLNAMAQAKPEVYGDSVANAEVAVDKMNDSIKLHINNRK